MADEPKRTGEEVLAANPKLAEMLAEKIPGIVGESMQAQFAEHITPQIAEMLKAARADVERKAPPIPKPGDQAQMSAEQTAELVRCQVLAVCGMRPQPKSDLDAGGIITQALTPTEGDQGAYLLPAQFVMEVEKRAAAVQDIWPLITQRTATARHVLKPEQTDYPVPNWGGASNVNSPDPTALIPVTPVRYGRMEWHLEDSAVRYPVKLDLFEESPVNIFEELVEVSADAFARDKERLPLVGRGHAHEEPLGLFDAAANIPTVAIDAAPTIANLLGFFRQLPKEYRRRATAVLPVDTYYTVGGELAVNVNSPKYLEETLRILPRMTDSAYVPDGSIIYGDFSRYVAYVIRQMQVVQGIVAERSMREIVIKECWTSQPTMQDAFRIGTGVEYGY